ncbi:exocyst complex component 1 [Pectinophora gossypiella]|nr:exocyst complex component 1 [Pectinophora gossypiella]
MVLEREEGKEVASAEVVSSGGRRQRLVVVARGDDAVLVLREAAARLRSWPLHAIKLTADQPGGNITVEAGGETLTWSCSDESSRAALWRAALAGARARAAGVGEARLADAALGALLEDAAPDDADAELWARRLADRLAKLDALNVAGMLAAATEGGGAALAERLETGVSAGAALSARLAKYEAIARAAPGASHARSGAARADANARALLTELDEIYKWLDSPALQDLESLGQVSLATPEGRARALAACEALRGALRAERQQPAARRRLAAVRDRLRRLQRARDQLAGALARQLNNALIHLGNEAATEPRAAQRRHADLLPHAPHTRWLKLMDEKAYNALLKVYVNAWSRVLEREIRSACEAAKTALATAPPERADELLDQVLTLVENLCNAEQDFCTQFFHLDVDVKADGSDGERSEKSEGGEREPRRAGAETRRLMAELFPALDAELAALLHAISSHDTYGAMRALACVGRRVLGGEAGAGAGAGGGEARWSRAALAGAAVAAKRGADKIVADRIAALPDAVKQAARKQKCGVLSFIAEFEELSRACEAIFARSARRADLERWYLALAAALLHAVHHADHPRTPKAILHMENYHRLHGVLSSLRVPALESTRKECKQRYQDSLRTYVTQYFGRPLEKLTLFFEGVSEAVAGGVREDEVCYRAAYSKHELRRLLALYPAHEVRKSLHRLYRLVEKHVSEESGLLQVVWRAMQEEFIAQHVQLQARIAACYPGAGLSMPLTTQDILDAFSDIAREH